MVHDCSLGIALNACIISYGYTFKLSSESMPESAVNKMPIEGIPKLGIYITHISLGGTSGTVELPHPDLPWCDLVYCRLTSPTFPFVGPPFTLLHAPCRTCHVVTWRIRGERTELLFTCDSASVSVCKCVCLCPCRELKLGEEKTRRFFDHVTEWIDRYGS
ncbi:unnamed protein product, partial [Timema podura]|nr:unnamed protein product [Timema podura]